MLSFTGGFGRPFFMNPHASTTSFTPCDWTDVSPDVERTEFERDAATQGIQRVAGVDEAGRGPLAGPIVAAAVMLADPIAGLDDSKRLSEKRRESLFQEITAGAHAVGIAVVAPETIDQLGIQVANYKAMTDALLALDPRPELALVDGFNVPGCPIRHLRIVKGDQRSCSIAAASIVAKVTRDRILHDLDAVHPEYGFARHKGYGTRQHLDAIEEHGPCPAHRRSFAPFMRTATTLTFDEPKRAQS